MKAILNRRSIRKYNNEPVGKDAITSLLKAAMAAPSARNQQPWEFVVIDNRKILDQVPNIHPYAQMIKEAPVAILVCGDKTREKTEGYWVQDCAAATENILIAAEDLSLGAVWLGVYPRKERVDGITKLLKLPNHIVPFALIPLGHPAEHKEPSNRFDTARIHSNGW